MSMQLAAEHVTYQLPNEHSGVGYLICTIHNSDAGLQADMTSANTDNDPSGMRNDFESAAAHLLSYDPAQNKRSNNNKRGAAEIPDFNGDDARVSAFGTKPSTGITGVNMCYQKLPNYEKLSKPQQDELLDWRKKTNEENEGKVKAKKPNTNTEFNNHTEKAITFTVNKQSHRIDEGY